MPRPPAATGGQAGDELIGDVEAIVLPGPVISPEAHRSLGCPCGCMSKPPYYLDPDCAANRPIPVPDPRDGHGGLFLPTGELADCHDDGEDGS